jgi:hypothetical protein
LSKTAQESRLTFLLPHFLPPYFSAPSSFGTYPKFHQAKMLGCQIGKIRFHFPHQRQFNAHGFPIKPFAEAMAIKAADC